MAIEQYEDRDVISTGIAVRNTGHGLEEAMKTEPVVLHHAETVYVVMECQVEKIRYDEIPETDALTRVQMLKAGTATILDAQVVKDAIAAQAKANQDRIDREKGQRTLEQEAAEALRSAHTLGEHANGLVNGCDLCDKERDEAEWEKAEGK